MLHNLSFFFSSKCRLFHNATFFGSCIIHILNTGVLKIKRKFRRQRVNPLSMYVYIGFKTLFYIVRHLDSIASYLPTGLHLGFFSSRPSLFLPSSFSSVFLVLSFVSASTSMLFWAVFLLPFFEHGHTMSAGSVQSLL